jgi:hypothetical protein
MLAHIPYFNTKATNNEHQKLYYQGNLKEILKVIASIFSVSYIG